MKQKTFDILLDCYIKERIPDAEDILGVSRVPVFCYSPTACVVTDGPRISNQIPKAQAFCYSPPAYVRTDGPRIYHQSDSPDFYPESLHRVAQAGFEASVDVIDSPDIDQIQKCREIARNLARIADSFQRDRTTSHDGNSRVSPDEYADDFTPEERLVLENILSQGPSQSISRIASVLADCFTSQTLKATIQYLTGRNDDVSQQLAVALELSTGLINLMGGNILGTIRSVVGGMFQNRAELEDL